MAELSEIQIQTQFRSRAAIQCPGVLVVAVPNAGKRSRWAAMQAKREGMQTGFPDVLCFWRGGGVAAIEFKTGKGRTSLQQVEWLNRLNEFGVPAVISRDPEHALDFLAQCGAPFVARLRRAA